MVKLRDRLIEEPKKIANLLTVMIPAFADDMLAEKGIKKQVVM